MLFFLEEKIKLFKELILADKLNHAYIFYGEPKVGKATFAKALAYFLEYNKFEILDKPLLDFKLIDKPLDEEKDSIGIDEIREIKNFLYQKPFVSKKRYVLIDQNYDLTFEAQSALLKILEEPPQYALIILIKNDFNNFLPTLVSRLPKIYFPRVANEKLEKVLVDNFSLKKDEVLKILPLSFGQIGKAIELLKLKDKIKLEVKNELDDFNLKEYLDNLIVKFYLKNKIKYSGLIFWLLNKKFEVSTTNLNKFLQKKVIELKLKIYESIN